MSATGRGAKREPNDFYVTPAWCVHRLLEACPWIRHGTILEPCAGDGAILKLIGGVKSLTTAVEVQQDPRMAASLREVAQHVFVGTDFRSWEPRHFYDTAISNPPFSIAEDIIRAATLCADRVVMLLRLNFLGSAERQPWFYRNMPDIYVLPNRPLFVRNKSDNCEYAWMVWHSGRKRRTGEVRVLNNTPLSERSHRRAA